MNKRTKKKLEPNVGLFWHVHHNTLCEWCWSAKERREYIRTKKPSRERATRLKLMKPVKLRGIHKDLKKILDDNQFNSSTVRYWIEDHYRYISRLHKKQCGCKLNRWGEIDFTKQPATLMKQ